MEERLTKREEHSDTVRFACSANSSSLYMAEDRTNYFITCSPVLLAKHECLRMI